MVEQLNRKRIKVWMREVLDQKGWSARGWAIKAGTSPTNITRFLNEQHDYVPSMSTIAKLADVAGRQPNLDIPDYKDGLRVVEIYDGDQVIDRVTVNKRDGKLIGYIVMTESYILGGIAPGDYIIVDKRQPELNELVAVKKDDTIMVYKYSNGRFLIPKSTNPNIEPHKITSDEKIIGVIYESRKMRWD